MHQYCRPMPLKEKNNFRLQNLVNVTLPCTTMKFVFFLPIMPPHTITLPPPNRSLSMKQLSAKRSPLLLKTRIRPSWWLRLILDSSEYRTRAHCCRPPTEMPLCPLQTGSPMTCCKHLSHIGPPWPNGLCNSGYIMYCHIKRKFRPSTG